MQEACCTCARLLSADPGRSGPEKTGLALPAHRRLDCCARVICGRCTSTNTRFAHYCPYCQISTGPSALPQGGLRAPPSYESSTEKSPSHPQDVAPPPPYTPPPLRQPPSQPFPTSHYDSNTAASEKPPLSATPDAPDQVLHYLDHNHDTIPSLSLRYAVPAPALRAANRLPNDALLAARRTVVIPVLPSVDGSGSGSGSGSGPAALQSLSPRPVGGEDEELRKAKIRRWMVACKEADYDVALLYLEGAGYDLALATEAYLADEEWEKAHPVTEDGRAKVRHGKSERPPSPRIALRWWTGGSLPFVSKFGDIR